MRTAEPFFPVVGMPKPTLHKDLPEIARDYAFVVIDGAPRVNELCRAAIMASDFVLIPVQPSPYDVPILDVALCQRVAFAESAAQGNTVLETEPAGLAAAEVHKLAHLVATQAERPTA